MAKKQNEKPVVTSADVAREANVSVGTVIRVLNNHENVDAALVERVQQAIAALGYVYTPKKRVTAGRSTTLQHISFCVPSQQLPEQHEGYYYGILRGVERECADHGISVLYTTLERNAVGQIGEIVRRNRSDGLILVNTSASAIIEEVQRRNLPTVAVDPVHPINLPVDAVMAAYFEGARQAVERLISLGHHEIALISGSHRYTLQRRFDGYRIALMDAELPFRPELVSTVHGALTIEAGRQALQTLLSRGESFSAVFCVNDNTALGVIRALTEAGLRVPEDVSVIGFDNIEAAALSLPSLTTVDANNEGKGRLAVRRLLDRAARANTPVSWSLLPTVLVERHSTAAR